MHLLRSTFYSLLSHDSGRGADRSTPALGAGDSDAVFGSASGSFDPEVPDFKRWRSRAGALHR
jgi:hypothetical protein